MSAGGNALYYDGGRIEIAVLQEDLDAKTAGWAKFKIPVVMTQDTVARVSASNFNILNKRNTTLSSAYINIENMIDLYVPQEYTYFTGLETIPAGTRFLVCFVGNNINDARIIGRYDYLEVDE